MKMNDLDKVVKLTNRRDACESATKQCINAWRTIKEHDSEECGVLSACSAGSGVGVNLRGCGVFSKVVEATAAVLADEIADIDKKLAELGVEVGR
jgi:hypothetical protein